MKRPENRKNILFGGTLLLANKLQAVGDKMVHGLSTKQWFLLRNITDMPKDPAPSITQIAKEMNSTRQNITKMLEIMEREGFVTLEQSKLDKRSQCVYITETGENYRKQMAQNAQDFFRRLYEDITMEEIEVASEVLVKMLDNLQIMEEEVTTKTNNKN